MVARRAVVSIVAGIGGLLCAAPGSAQSSFTPEVVEAKVETQQGVSLSWDQTVTDRRSVSVEWVSGNNWYGYLSPGVTYAWGQQRLFAGYCIGANREANHGPCVSAGRSF